MGRIRTLATAAALTTLAAVGTGASLSYYEEALPTTMNPLFARSMVDRRASELVFDRLYYRSAVTSEIKSRIVESENRLDGGMALELKLRDGGSRLVHLSQHGIGGGNGRFRHQPGSNHVAEIDDTDDLVAARVDQNIVSIGVVVNNRVA